MAIATRTAREVTSAIATGRNKDRNPASLVFLGALWFSLFFGVMVLVVLIVNTAIDGASRFDGNLITGYDSILRPEETGFRAGILGSVWLMVGTALLAIPLGIAAAVYLEEFADTRHLVQPLHRGQHPEPRRGAVDRLRPAGGGRDGADRLRPRPASSSAARWRWRC